MTGLYYYIGVVVALLAILITTYKVSGKITVEDIIVSLIGSMFSWFGAVIIPLVIACDDASFMDKVIFGKNK